MSENLKVLQVFIASPNDLVDKRCAIKEVADGLNTAFGTEVGLQIQPLGWKDRLPGYGRAQAQIKGGEGGDVVDGAGGSPSRTSLR
jgi:hypothetical protein